MKQTEDLDFLLVIAHLNIEQGPIEFVGSFACGSIVYAPGNWDERMLEKRFEADDERLARAVGAGFPGNPDR